MILDKIITKIITIIMAIVWTFGAVFYIGAGIVVAKTASTSCLFIIFGGFCILGGVLILFMTVAMLIENFSSK